MIETITLSSKGQIVIPERTRKRFNIKKGSRLVLFERGNSMLLKKESEVDNLLIEEEKRENAGWLILAEKSLKEVWDNKKDDEVWKKYL